VPPGYVSFTPSILPPPGELSRLRLDTSRQLHQDEISRWVEIILLALVNDAEVVVLGGILVREYSIDLAEFERSLVLVVVHTNSK